LTNDLKSRQTKKKKRKTKEKDSKSYYFPINESPPDYETRKIIYKQDFISCFLEKQKKIKF
jgi:hypothetical protein